MQDSNVQASDRTQNLPTLFGEMSPEEDMVMEYLFSESDPVNCQPQVHNLVDQSPLSGGTNVGTFGSSEPMLVESSLAAGEFSYDSLGHYVGPSNNRVDPFWSTEDFLLDGQRGSGSQPANVLTMQSCNLEFQAPWIQPNVVEQNTGQNSRGGSSCISNSVEIQDPMPGPNNGFENPWIGGEDLEDLLMSEPNNGSKTQWIGGEASEDLDTRQNLNSIFKDVDADFDGWWEAMEV
jgi:hypothetical protein